MCNLKSNTITNILNIINKKDDTNYKIAHLKTLNFIRWVRYFVFSFLWTLKETITFFDGWFISGRPPGALIVSLMGNIFLGIGALTILK